MKLRFNKETNLQRKRALDPFIKTHYTGILHYCRIYRYNIIYSQILERKCEGFFKRWIFVLRYHYVLLFKPFSHTKAFRLAGRAFIFHHLMRRQYYIILDSSIQWARYNFLSHIIFLRRNRRNWQTLGFSTRRKSCNLLSTIHHSLLWKINISLSHFRAIPQELSLFIAGIKSNMCLQVLAKILPFPLNM